jgi:D-apionolactonase
MMSYFTELNRKRPPRNLFDFITHSICPIVHDASDGAVMQTLETLPHIFASVRAMIGSEPYHLGPTTIAARMNPYGKAVSANPHYGRVCLAPNDPRQFGTFAAAWTLGLIVEASRAGERSLCLGTFCGPRGLLDSKAQPSALYRTLDSLLPHCGKRVHVSSVNGLAAVAATRLTLGNTTGSEIKVESPTKSQTIDAYSVKLTDTN